jgi:hypothetical protein
LLKVAVIGVLGQAPAEAFAGVTEVEVGAVTPGLLPALSGSLHPTPTTSRRKVANPTMATRIFRLFTSALFFSTLFSVRMTDTFFSPRCGFQDGNCRFHGVRSLRCLLHVLRRDRTFENRRLIGFWTRRSARSGNLSSESERMLRRA